MSAFKWDQQKEDAAALLAVGELTNDAIAEKVGTSPATLYRWKDSREFNARVEQNVEEIRKRLMSCAIADRAKRVARLNKRWMQIDRLIDARSNAPEMMNAAGGDTGLLAHEQRSLGSGDLATVVDVYKADTPLLKEERELAKQAAIELGQWEEQTLDEAAKGITKIYVVGPTGDSGRHAEGERPSGSD